MYPNEVRNLPPAGQGRAGGQGDGTVKVFGPGMPDGPLAAATGQLEKVKHNGCYHADRKREERAGR
jgi:hypothetical protein